MRRIGESQKYASDAGSPSARVNVSCVSRGIAVAESVFTPAECDEIARLGRQGKVEQAVVYNQHGGAFELNLKDRSVRTACMHRDSDVAWIYDRMDVYFRAAGVLMGIDVGETREPIKVMFYGVGDHFELWHRDVGREAYGEDRRISMSVELSGPEEFEGGRLEFHPGFSVSQPGKGGATIFASYKYHRVTKVTRGSRHSLVNWIGG